jgi:hypothetical protein
MSYSEIVWRVLVTPPRLGTAQHFQLFEFGPHRMDPCGGRLVRVDKVNTYMLVTCSN